MHYLQPRIPNADLIQQKLGSTKGLNINDIVERNPFGSMGVDFGNVLGNIGSKSMGGETLSSTNEEKILGLHINSDFT